MNSTVLLKTDMPVVAPAPAVIVIERTHHSQSAAGLAVLNHVANRPDGCRLDELLPVFVAAKVGERPECATAHNLLNLLGSLSRKGQLVGEGRGTGCLWRLGADVRIKPGHRALAAAVHVGQRTPAPQYDLRRAPVYVPARSTEPRAGSLDFKRLASHGYGC